MSVPFPAMNETRVWILSLTSACALHRSINAERAMLILLVLSFLSSLLVSIHSQVERTATTEVKTPRTIKIHRIMSRSTTGDSLHTFPSQTIPGLESIVGLGENLYVMKKLHPGDKPESMKAVNLFSFWTTETPREKSMTKTPAPTGNSISGSLFFQGPGLTTKTVW